MIRIDDDDESNLKSRTGKNKIPRASEEEEKEGEEEIASHTINYVSRRRL